MLRVLLLTTFCLASSLAYADAPFVPPGVRPPDYELAKVKKVHGRDEDDGVVQHHGDWTRLTNPRVPGATYYLSDGITSVSAGGWLTWIQRGLEREPGYDYEAHNTGERQTHLGETCTVWETVRTNSPVLGDHNFSHLNCITDDGIEMWKKSISKNGVNWSVEATQLERRPISADEVHPPRTMLALDWWDQDATARDVTVDHETDMELSDRSNRAKRATRTVRRHGVWQFSEEIDGAQRHIVIADKARGIRFEYESDERGAPRMLRFWKPAAVEPVAGDRYDTVLGEACRWFDMTPLLADAGTQACLTNDGVMLRERIFSRITERIWTATRVVRRPVSIDETKPPAELLQPHTWALD